ncbi:MAG: thioredoxin family protein [Crocinitomicaceae bacterium]
MKRFLTLATLLLTVSFAFAQHGTQATSEGSSDSPKINWITFEEAFALHQEEPKKWVIDVWTTWCGWCKRMDATTFSDSLVVEHINQNFYAVSLDGEYKEDIQIGERTYKFVPNGRRGYHELPAELMGGKMSYPTYIFLSEELQNLTAVAGYRVAKDFLQIVEFFEAYDSENPMKWEDFVATYKSPYPEGEGTSRN